MTAALLPLISELVNSSSATVLGEMNALTITLDRLLPELRNEVTEPRPSISARASASEQAPAKSPRAYSANSACREVPIDSDIRAFVSPAKRKARAEFLADVDSSSDDSEVIPINTDNVCGQHKLERVTAKDAAVRLVLTPTPH